MAEASLSDFLGPMLQIGSTVLSAGSQVAFYAVRDEIRKRGYSLPDMASRA